MSKFKVGDYVVSNISGVVGKVTNILPDNYICVESQHCITHGSDKNFTLYTKDQPNKIVITTDGCTTTAKMYRDKSVVGVQTTKCHPDDRFDFLVGAKIALDRLVGCKEEEPKYYNGKVVCVDNNDFHFYTTGKVYQIKDGVAYDDYGDKFRFTPFVSVYELNKWSDAKWLEVVE